MNVTPPLDGIECAARSDRVDFLASADAKDKEELRFVSIKHVPGEVIY